MAASWTTLLSLLILCPLVAHAQPAGTGVPDAGSILQQIQPIKPPPPSPAGPGLRIDQEGGAELPPGTPFEVKSIRISGNTVFATPVLHALVTDAEGSRLTLSQLTGVVARITDYYHRHGYPLSRAIIRAQVIREGVVDVEVIEARYGRIGLDNRSRVNDPLLQATLSSLQSGELVSQAGIDHALLLLSDIPGVVVDATLKPGAAVGTSDLLVSTAPGPAVVANVSLDNYGNRYTGRARIGGSVNIIDPLHHGDLLTVSGLSSGSGLEYARLGYESLLNGQGTRLGAAYSALDYDLGGSLEPLRAHGAAQVASLWARHPLVRRGAVNLQGQIQYDRLKLQDHIDASAIRTDRHLDTWTASLGGDVRDALLSGAVSTWNVGWTSGRVGFDDAAAQLADAGSANTQGGFSKWNARFARLQGLSPKNRLYAALSGQWVNANLDPSQKMTAGGPYAVRAYEAGAISGDTGHLLTVEFRRDLGFGYGQWQAVAFADHARVRVNKNPWVAGADSATLNGAGLGLDWSGPENWHARAYVAARIGAPPALIANAASVRAWIEIGKAF
jgi:hemolysin activation/secretion protein